MSKLGAYLQIMRPVNCLMMGFAVLVGSVLAESSIFNLSSAHLLYGYVTGFALTAGSMTINDYVDRKIDAINEPRRPIPSGSVKPRDALWFALVLTAIGFAAALPTGILTFVMAAVAWVIFTAYTAFGKRSGLPGNFLVSMCVGIPFVYGSVLATGGIQLNVLIFVSMVFLSNTGREITKGIVDIEGDRKQGIQTLAVRLGDKTAAIAAALFYVSATALSPIPVLLGRVSLWFIPFVAVTDTGLLWSSGWLLKNHSRENARRIKRIVLLWFLVGLLAFLAGAVL